MFEVRKRMYRKANLDHQFQQADGLRVVGGIKSDGTEKTEESAPEEPAKPLVEELKVEKSVEEPKVEESVEEPKVEQLTLVEPTAVAEPKSETPKEKTSTSQIPAEAVPKS